MSATIAHPLGGVTGVGMWPLAGNGMNGVTVDGHAVFAWLDGSHIMGAAAGVDDVVELASIARGPLLFFREHETRTELLAFDSSPAIRALTLSCR